MREDEYVTIAQFWEPQQPLFLKSVLEAYGIDARLQGEFAGNITPFLGVFGGSPRGGVELQVRQEDVAEAREILSNPPGMDVETGADEPAE